MNLTYPCICVALTISIAIIISIYLWRNREKYVLLRFLGTNPHNIPFSDIVSSSKTKKGQKYKGHRYDREHIRRNPNKIY
jgi:hypothetical protein